MLSVSLIKIVTTNLRVEQAKGTLDRLDYEVKNLQDGQKFFTIDSPREYIVLANGSTLCVCPGEYLAQLKNQKDIDNGEIFSLCRSASLCVDNFSGVLDVSLFNTEGKTEFSSLMCSAKNAVTDSAVWWGTTFVPNCIFISTVPFSLQLSKDAGSSVVSIIPFVTTNKQNRKELLDKIVNSFNSESVGKFQEGFDYNKIMDTHSFWYRALSTSPVPDLYFISYTKNDKNGLCLCDTTGIGATAFLDQRIRVCEERGLCEETKNRMLFSTSKIDFKVFEIYDLYDHSAENNIIGSASYLKVSSDNTGVVYEFMPKDGNKGYYVLSLLPAQ